MNKVAAGKQRTGNRMQSIECFRLLSSILIVIAHCTAMEGFGMAINCLARVTVPYFFVVSGYFSYNARESTIRKRFWSVLKLNIFANVLYLLWDGYHRGFRDLKSMAEWSVYLCSGKNLMKTLFLNDSPIRNYLWYLHAIVLCYAAIWLYVRWMENGSSNYKPLYIVCVCLYAIHVVLSSFATACEFDVPYRIYRNALLYGLPMFCLGIFLHEYNDKIIRAYKLTRTKLVGLIFAGICLVFLQFDGIGRVEMPVGALLEVIAWMLLLVMVPTVSNSAFVSGMIAMFGPLSTYIYVAHMIWVDVYTRYIKPFLPDMGERMEEILYPAAVLGLTLITGILYVGLQNVWKKQSAKRRLAK